MQLEVEEQRRRAGDFIDKATTYAHSDIEVRGDHEKAVPLIEEAVRRLSFRFLRLRWGRGDRRWRAGRPLNGPGVTARATDERESDHAAEGCHCLGNAVTSPASRAGAIGISHHRVG